MSPTAHPEAKRPTTRAIVPAALAALVTIASGSGVLAPEWSRPLPAPMRAVSTGRLDSLRDRAYLLLADRLVLAVSEQDTARSLGLAPVGVTALTAVRTAADRRQPVPAIFLAGPRAVIAWDRDGRELWQCSWYGPAAVDSIGFVDRAASGAYRLCAWYRGEPLLITAAPGSSTVRRLELGFLPRDGLVADVDGDSAPELVAADGEQVLVTSLEPGREFRLSWPGDTAAIQTQTPLCLADFDYDRRQELLVLAGRDCGTLRCVDGLTGRERWQLTPDVLPGPVVAMAAAGGRVCVAGPDNRLAVFDHQGVRRDSARVLSSSRLTVYALQMLGSWPLVFFRQPDGPGSFALLSPRLAGGLENTAGYQGVRIGSARVLRLDRDTFPDVIVVRSAADVPLRLDAFRNGLGRLEQELSAAQQAVHAAGRRSDQTALRRASRRAALLARQLDIGGSRARAGEELGRWFYHAVLRRRRAAAGAALAAALLLASVILLLTLRRRRPQGRRLEDKPLAVRTALAADLVAMDHNYVTKGNYPAALARLKELRDRYDLAADVRLAGLTDQLEPYYTDTVGRLIDDTPTDRVLALVEGAARSTGRTVPTVEMTRDEFRRARLTDGFRIILVRNREYPGIYQRLRLFTNPQVRGVMEHVVLDHFRYARHRAAVVFDYVVNTQWNRRFTMLFLSDSEQGIDFARRDGHLVSQLAELGTALRPALEVPGPDYEPADPDERLWLRATDLVSVLEETRERLTRK